MRRRETYHQRFDSFWVDFQDDPQVPHNQIIPLSPSSSFEQGKERTMEMAEQHQQQSNDVSGVPDGRCCFLPQPGRLTTSRSRGNCCWSERNRPMSCAEAPESSEGGVWNRIFAEAYRADVSVHTNDGIIPAHACVLGMSSPVIKAMLKKSKNRGSNAKSISIRGVPHDAVRVFLQFMYSNCLEQQEMNQYVLHLLVLSHVFLIPSLKKMCEQHLEGDLLTVDNVVDVYQLALLCDAPRLQLLCHRLIVNRFKEISFSEGWKVMRKSNPALEKELLESVIDADTKKSERFKKLEEKEIYLQLHEAMEALDHICRDGCRTIGPCDKVLKQDAGPCNFPACKGLEALVRHFAGCKNRVLGGCSYCKRMWQLLELHSHICDQADCCKVPLCRHFKEKLRHQCKKDDIKWKLLVNKVLEAKNFARAPRFPLRAVEGD